MSREQSAVSSGAALALAPGLWRKCRERGVFGEGWAAARRAEVCRVLRGFAEVWEPWTDSTQLHRCDEAVSGQLAVNWFCELRLPVVLAGVRSGQLAGVRYRR